MRSPEKRSAPSTTLATSSATTRHSAWTTPTLPPGATETDRAEAHRWIDKTLDRIGPDVQVDRLLIESESIAGGIARASKDFDLVVLGAGREPIFRQVLFGEIPEKVARYSPASVLVVKQYEGHVRSMFKRIFG